MFNLLIILLLFIIIILLIYLIIIQQKKTINEPLIEEINTRVSTNLFNQLESYHFIRDRLNLQSGLPYTRDWSASPDFLKLITEHCLTNKPQTIVECSSGLSSLVLARCCQINQQGHLYSLENGAEYAVASQQHIHQYNLDEYAHIIHAPLIQYSLNHKNYQWYDISTLPDITIDMLVIDGPPGFIQKHSRYPALPLLFKKLAKDCVIFMDDAVRDEEKEIVEMWLGEFSNFEHEYVSLMRGCSVLKKL